MDPPSSTRGEGLRSAPGSGETRRGLGRVPGAARFLRCCDLAQEAAARPGRRRGRRRQPQLIPQPFSAPRVPRCSRCGDLGLPSPGTGGKFFAPGVSLPAVAMGGTSCRNRAWGAPGGRGGMAELCPLKAHQTFARARGSCQPCSSAPHDTGQGEQDPIQPNAAPQGLRGGSSI